MKNKEIAHIFETLADILEITDEDAVPREAPTARSPASSTTFRPTSRSLPRRAGSPTSPASGRGRPTRIEEYLATGSIAAYEEAKKTIPVGLVELLSVPGLGPKTIGLLWRQLGVKSLRGLKRVIRGRKILELPGIGPKKVENIEAGVRAYESRSGTAHARRRPADRAVGPRRAQTAPGRRGGRPRRVRAKVARDHRRHRRPRGEPASLRP